MTAEPIITTERVDDFPLLLATMLQIGLPDIFDRHLKRHGLHQGLSWGWIASIWLAHLLAKSNHRKQPVQTWVKQARATIEKITGQEVRDLDFSDDRLTLLLRRLSKPNVWQAIEKELSLTVRMLTLLEFVVRHNLKQHKEKLTGLIENNPKKGVDNTTTERLL